MFLPCLTEPSGWRIDVEKTVVCLYGIFLFLLQTKHLSTPKVWRRSVCATCSCRFYILCSRIHSGRQPFINYDKYRLVFSILKTFPPRLLLTPDVAFISRFEKRLTLISLVGKKMPRSELDLEEFIVWFLWKIEVVHLVIDNPLLVTRKPEKVKNYKWGGKSDSSESFLHLKREAAAFTEPQCVAAWPGYCFDFQEEQNLVLTQSVLLLLLPRCQLAEIFVNSLIWVGEPSKVGAKSAESPIPRLAV